jgi:hypothetical protein
MRLSKEHHTSMTNGFEESVCLDSSFEGIGWQFFQPDFVRECESVSDGHVMNGTNAGSPCQHQRYEHP